MSLGAILVGAGMLLVAVIVVSQPFSSKQSGKQDMVTSLELVDPYQETLLALRDLDFDYQTGAIAEADYQPLRSQLMAQVVQARTEKRQTEEKLEDQIETAVRGYRQKRTKVQIHGAHCPVCQATITAGDKFCTACGTTVTTVCPHCQQACTATDKFCTHCGQSLRVDAEVLA